MTQKKEKLIRNDAPGSDSLNANMRQVARSGVFPLISASADNQRRHAGFPSDLGPEQIIANPRGSRKIGTDLTE